MRMLKLFEIVFHHINFRDISTTNPQGRPAYLWGILGQWDILLFNLTSIGFTIFLDVSSLTFPFLQMLML